MITILGIAAIGVFLAGIITVLFVPRERTRQTGAERRRRQIETGRWTQAGVVIAGERRHTRATRATEARAPSPADEEYRRIMRRHKEGHRK